MHYYQLIYTASESGRTGQPGFGIRSVSEGFPEYLIPLVDGKMTSYHSGAFENISGAKLAENPNRIQDYPRSYFYNVVKLENGKRVFFLGRVIATGFDYPFFKTGNPSTRTGNYVSHIFIFEETPDSSIFDLLFESPLPGNASFLPEDVSPTTSNEELKALLLGPSVPLEIAEKTFSSSAQGVSEESIDVLFDLVAALNEGKRLIVKMDAKKAPSVCAGLMRLLPEKYAQEMTFAINHQEEGVSAGTRITFINQYYQYSAPVGNVKMVDYLNSSHATTPLEKKWRATIGKFIQDNDLCNARIISSWLLNKLSTRLVEQSDDLSWSLIRYLYIPEEFTLGEIVEVEGLLPLLAKLISADPYKNALLTSLLSREFEKAQDDADINLLITVCEQVAASGISTNEVYEKAKQTITSYVSASPENLNGVLKVHSVPVLKKYLDLSLTSRHKEFLSSVLLIDKWETAYSIFYQQPFPHKEILVRMQSLQLSEHQIKTVLKEICPCAEERVRLYVDRLKENPEELRLYEPYLEWDIIAADKIDYVTEFRRFFEREEFAPYFLQSIEYRKDSLPPVETLKICKEISDKNAAFKDLLLHNSTIYGKLYKRVVEFIKGKATKSFDSFIDSSVLPLIADSNPAKKDWSNLRDVLSLSVPESTWPYACYVLAIEIKAADYIRKISPKGFNHFESLEDVTGFVDALYDIAGYSDKDILATVKTVKSSHVRSNYIVAIAKKKDMAFEKVMELTEMLSIKEQDGFYSEFFKKEYRFQKFKNIFKKKDKDKK